MIKVIGAGLAGCEAAAFLAEHGKEVELYDIKPKSFTPAHSNPDFCELVCSNSLKGADPFSNACGLLKEEMRILGSVTMRAADVCRVPAGGALAVDRDKFAACVTEKITKNKRIKVVCREIKSVPEGLAIIATGPLTSKPLADDISGICGGQLKFYDASAPIVSGESLDTARCFEGARYGRGGDYLNCPLTREEYDIFLNALLSAERAELHSFEKGEIFEGCMPVETLAERGRDSLRFAMLKPVGLTDGDGKKYFAVLQLRKENVAGDAYNLVGFQTNLKFSEQKRVFSLIPALKNAEFLRYGVMHANFFVNSPKCLNGDNSLKARPDVFLAGQITGVEGYVESAASGIVAAIGCLKKMRGEEFLPPPADTMLGALCAYIRAENKNFQPMNANYGILPPLEKAERDKRERYKKLSARAIESMQIYKENLRL